MGEDELAELERLAENATAPPWSAVLLGDDENRNPEPDEVTGAFVYHHAGRGFRHEDLKVVEVDGIELETHPDNGVEIAGRREVNRGYYVETGDSHMPEDVRLKPADALFIAACREAVPKLVAEVRRLRAERGVL